MLTPKILCFRDEMGWLASFDQVNGDPNNTVDPLWRHLFYLSGHKLAIHKKALASLLFAGFSLFNDLLPSIALLSVGDPSLSVVTIASIQNTTRILTLINPHHYTAWNTRKQLILHFPRFNAPITGDSPDESVLRSFLIAESCQRELNHIELALSKQPKSVEAWAHRKWVLHTLSLNQTSSSYQFEDSREVKLCNSSANTHKRNYYTWTHRLYIVQHWKGLALSDSNIPSQNARYSAFLKLELQDTWRWLQRHTSDASAAHHLMVVLKHLKIADLSEVLADIGNGTPEDATKALLNESTKYLTLYQAGETWWYVRRAIISLYILESLGTLGSPEALERVQAVLKTEIQELSLLCSDAVQAPFACRHLLWLIHSLKEKLRIVNQELCVEMQDAVKYSDSKLRSLGWKCSLE
jgi:hypothetical protein